MRVVFTAFDEDATFGHFCVCVCEHVRCMVVVAPLSHSVGSQSILWSDSDGLRVGWGGLRVQHKLVDEERSQFWGVGRQGRIPRVVTDCSS